MSPESFYATIVQPTLDLMAREPAINVPRSAKADVLVMTIAGQESNWQYRRQLGIGQYHPQTVGARGYWQCESTWGGPVAINDVMQSPKLAPVCSYLEIPTDELTLYEAIAWNDTLACAVARLLLWRDSAPLPGVGDKEAAYQYYLRNWKPGAPHHDSWSGLYDQSLAAMGSRV